MSLDQKPTIGSAFKLDKYELTREIAGSGVATTWAAQAPDDEKSYVVLRLHRNVTKKADAGEAFLRDAETGKLASHPNLIPVMQCGSTDGEVFVVSEHFAGEALSTLIAHAKTDGLPAAVALRIGREMLEGLAAAHAATPAVAHGELNPFHIIVGNDGVTRIAGFGWAHALSKFGPHGLLKPDRLGYAPPERVKALSAATANTPTPPFEVAGDVFAAGVILWELVSKQRLFASKMEAAVVQKVTGGPIAALASQPGVKVPSGLTDAIHKALERDPAKRSASIDDMLQAIRAIPEEEFAKPEDVSAIVEKLAAKAAAAPTPAALRVPIGARPLPVAPKPATLTAKDGSPASVRPKPTGPLPRAVPTRKATLLGGLDPTKADLPKASVTARPNPMDKKADAADKPAEKPVPKPLSIGSGESKRPGPPPPPPPRASAPPPPKLGMPKPPTFTGKPETPTPPPVRAAVESLAADDIDVAPDSSPKPAEEAQAPVVISALASGLEKATIPVPSMLALKEEAAKEAAKAPPKPVGDEKEAGIEVDIAVEAGEQAKPIESATLEMKTAEMKAADAIASKEVTVTAHTPASHPSASPRDSDEAPQSRSTTKSSALDKLKPRSTLGRYEILMRVAQGGMASVWAARLQGTRGFQKIVAIKTMLPDVSDDPDFETMFLDEARVAARIRHPNVVEIFDLGEQDDVLYLVMEWVEGDTLSGIQKASRRLGGIPQNITLRLASQVCAGMHAAHELRDDNGTLVDLVHRDISPGNILISTSGFAKVTDFGVAKSAGRLHVTRAEGMVKGKTPYLSPEQLGTLPLDRRSDLFSLGVLLYVMVTGLHPFRGDSEFKTVENIALKDPIPPIQLVPSCHPDLDKLIVKALEKDRTKRFATAADMQRALDHVAAQVGDPVTDDDVAGFVRKCIGDFITKNSNDLRAAIAAADASAADRISITSEAPRPPADSKPDVAPAAISEGRDATIDVANDGAAAVAAAAAVTAAVATTDTNAVAFPAADSANDTDEPKKKKNNKGVIIGIVAAAAVAAGVLGVVLTSGGGDKPTTPTTDQAATTQTAEPAPAQTAEPPPSQTAAPTVETAAPSASAEPPPAEEPKVEEPVATVAPTATQAPTATNKTWKPSTGVPTSTNKTIKTAPTATTKTTKKTTKYDPGGI